MIGFRFAHVAELADAYGSGPYGETLGGSNPLVSKIFPPMQDPTFVLRLFSSIARRYDFTNHLLSGGLDYAWRARAVQIVRSWEGSRILDVATGSGDLGLALRRACPQAEIIGVDFCQAMLLEAQKKGFRALVNGNGIHLPFRSEIFDIVTVAFGLRNMESWPKALHEMARVLSPGGRLLILDFSMSQFLWFRAAYRIYLHRLLPIVARWVTGNHEAYRYLGESIEQFPCGGAMIDLLETNGFQAAQAHPLCFGIVSLYTAQRHCQGFLETQGC